MLSISTFFDKFKDAAGKEIALRQSVITAIKIHIPTELLIKDISILLLVLYCLLVFTTNVKLSRHNPVVTETYHVVRSDLTKIATWAVISLVTVLVCHRSLGGTFFDVAEFIGIAHKGSPQDVQNMVPLV